MRNSIGIGGGPPVCPCPPVCPYGYYGYAPYSCVPVGYYGPGYFYNGIFPGMGRLGYSHGWGGHRFSSVGGGRYMGGGSRGYVGGNNRGNVGGPALQLAADMLAERLVAVAQPVAPARLVAVVWTTWWRISRWQWWHSGGGYGGGGGHGGGGHR
jgi:hypothetical protein